MATPLRFYFINSKSWPIPFSSNTKHRSWFVAYVQQMFGPTLSDLLVGKKKTDFLKSFTRKFRQCDFLLRKIKVEIEIKHTG